MGKMKLIRIDPINPANLPNGKSDRFRYREENADWSWHEVFIKHVMRFHKFNIHNNNPLKIHSCRSIQNAKIRKLRK